MSPFFTLCTKQVPAKLCPLFRVEILFVFKHLLQLVDLSAGEGGPQLFLAQQGRFLVHLAENAAAAAPLFTIGGAGFAQVQRLGEVGGGVKLSKTDTIVENVVDEEGGEGGGPRARLHTPFF